MDIKIGSGIPQLVKGKVAPKVTSNTDFHKMFMESLSQYDDKKIDSDTSGIGEFLTDSIKSVSDAQMHADNMNKQLILGETDNLHGVMIANQKAEMTLNFAIEVKNKVVEAYKEITRLQL